MDNIIFSPMITAEKFIQRAQFMGELSDEQWNAYDLDSDGNLIVGNGSTWVAENGGTASSSLGLGTISTQAANSVSISGGSITGLGAPSSGSDAATKTYVDDLVAGLKTRIICRAATTANVTLSSDLQNGDTLDGITLATGNRVLVKNQSTASQNGIYTVVSSGTAARDTDFNAIGELAGQLVIIQEGSTNAEKMYIVAYSFLTKMIC